MTTTSSPASTPDLQQVRLEKLLQLTSHNFELRVGFGPRDELDNDAVVLGLAADEVAGARYPALKGKALNLLGHYLADAGASEAEAQDIAGSGSAWFVRLWHALEDARVENGMLLRWPGMGKVFKAKLPPNLGGSLLAKAARHQQLELGLYLAGRGISGAHLEPAVQEALGELAPLIQQGAGAESPQGSLEAMRVIYPRLAALLGRGRPRSAHPEERESAGRAADQERGADRGPSGVPEIELEDGLVWARPQGKPRHMPEWYRPGSAPWFEAGLGDKHVHPSAMRSDRQTILVPPRGDLAGYQALLAEVWREAGYLAARLIRLLQEDSYLRFAGRYRSGQLEMNRLWKQRLADYRLFQRRQISERQAIAVSLLVDESASMQGREKHRLAAKAAVLLGETLSRLQVPFEIIGFTTAGFEAREAMRLGLIPAYEHRTTRCSPLAHRLYKSFQESYRQVRTRLAGIQPRHNNWDEEHLLFAYRRIRARPEPSRLILVVGDGQPNGDANHLIRTVAAVERLGCKVIGIGIGEEFVRRIYRNAIVVEDFRQLAEGLLSMLAGEFRHGTPAARHASVAEAQSSW